MDKVARRREPHAEVVHRRVVVNPTQARHLLASVRRTYPSLEAFFACLYYAGLRPAEARHLRRTDLRLPSSGWGELTLAGSTQSSGSAWTDSGAADEDRSLKHRPRKEARQVPAHPELVAILQHHLASFECSPDGRLFVSRTGIMGRPLPRPFSKPLPMGTGLQAVEPGPQRSPQSPLRWPSAPTTCATPASRRGSTPACRRLRWPRGRATASTSCSGSTPSASSDRRNSRASGSTARSPMARTDSVGAQTIPRICHRHL